MVECPGDGVIRNRARCRQGDHWVDCYRDTCCPGYTLIVNRCIPDNEVKQGSNKSTLNGSLACEKKSVFVVIYKCLMDEIHYSLQ